MSEHDLRTLLDVCQQALGRPAAERAAFLDEACGADARLRAAADALLAEEADAAGLLETPVWTPELAAHASGVAVVRREPAVLGPAAAPVRRGARTIPGSALSAWPWAVIAIAAARVSAALALFLSGHARAVRAPLPLEGYVALVCTFGILGLILVAANRRDVRALWLGGVFLLAASPFSMPLVLASQVQDARWLIYSRADAFLPALLWRFVCAFPSPLTGRLAGTGRGVWRTAAAIGLVFTLVSFSYLIWPPTVDGLRWRGWLSPQTGAVTLYDPLVFGFSIVAFPALLWRAWRAREDDRRRVLLFSAGFVAGSAPLVLETILESVFPSYARFVHQPGVETLVIVVLFGALAVVPLITAYSVLFDRVVELRVALRAAAQYALARYTILTATMVPFAALALLFISHRDEPLEAFLAGPRPILLGATACAGLVAMRLRRRWIDVLDRRFFREQYDARHMIDRLATDAIQSVDARDLAARIHGAIAAALHAEATLVAADERFGVLRDPQGACDDIPSNAILVNLAVALDDPMDVDPSDDRSPFRRLPSPEQRWLLRGGFRLLLPLRGTDGRPIGILALTSKRSGLEYSDDDRRLLTALAASASLALENLRLRSAFEPPSSPAARECPRCERLADPHATTCTCGVALVTSLAPYELRGVYRLDRRLGEGGMGVVYHARDLDLDRSVAVKTLPRVTPEAAARLRTEARAMAAVVHPNLAVVYGIETWQGIPFLVEEFLGGGTLADRLREGRMPVAKALDLGITLSDAIGHLHGAGIVHRDIKPSNIGFTMTGVVKLLDFGLARLAAAPADGREESTAPSEPGPRRAPRLQPTARGLSEFGAVGTPAYMAPEALKGGEPRPSFDLWSLAVVLYEAMTGRRPFEERPDGIGSTGARAALERVSDLVDGCPAAIDDYFNAALDLDDRRRLTDAKAVRVCLQKLRAKCS